MGQTEQDRVALFLEFQQAEIDGAALYGNIARDLKDLGNRNIMNEIAQDEIKHALIFETYTQTKLKPNVLKVGFYIFLSKIFGYTFSIKHFERGEGSTNRRYKSSPWKIPELDKMMEDEERHEDLMIAMLNEERVRYTGSIVLGLNDALVELTGSLAGYTLAMRNTHLIAMAGLITGISATLSMAASGFMSARADGRADALKSSIYTGFAYLITVLLLIFPYLVLGKDSYMTALFFTMSTAIAIIAIFNGYVSVVLDRSFKRGFLEMSGLSLGVAAISFVIGIVVKQVLGIDI